MDMNDDSATSPTTFPLLGDDDVDDGTPPPPPPPPSPPSPAAATPPPLLLPPPVDTAGLIEDSREPVESNVDFDEVLRVVDRPAIQQVCHSAILMSLNVPYGMAVFSFVFIGYEPPSVCARVNETNLLSKFELLNETSAGVSYESCQIRVTSNSSGVPADVALTPCFEGHRFVGGQGVSMKTEWGLVCEKNGLAELFQTMFNLGMAVGSLTVNPLSDIFGRKKMLVISGILNVAFEFLVVFSPTFSVADILKTLSGIFTQNLSITNNAYGQELIQTKHRPLFGVCLVFVFTTGMMCLGVVAYAIQHYSWRNLQLFAALSGIPPLVCLIFLEESTAWLLAQGEHSKALEIIKRACDKGGSNFNVAKEAYEQCVIRAKRIQEKSQSDGKAVAKYGIMDICRHRKLLATTLALMLGYFTLNTTYIGLYLTSAISSNIDRHFVFLILAATEFPSSLLCLYLIQGTGRRKIVMTFLSLASACLVASVLLNELGSPSSEHLDNASTAVFIMGKFCINLSYTCLYAFTPDFFPTTLRNIGFGLTVCMARIGGMVAPFLFPLFKIASWAPGALLAALCVITVCIYPLVPETKGKELPTTMESFEALFIQKNDGKTSGAKQRHALGCKNSRSCLGTGVAFNTNDKVELETRFENMQSGGKVLYSLGAAVAQSVVHSSLVRKVLGSIPADGD